MITLTELAKALNVSVATVSNALSGKGRMREEKRRKIIEAAVDAGYDIGSVLERQRKRSICVIMEQIGNLFSDKIVCGICSEAEGSSSVVTVCNLNMLEKYGHDNILIDDERLRSLISATINRVGSAVSGIIYVSQSPRKLAVALPKLPYPFVCAYCGSAMGYPSVNYDDAQGAYLATQALVRAGGRRIAMISGPINTIPMTGRLNGYQRALVEHGLPFDPRLMQVGEWSAESGYACASRLLDGEEKPDAIFCQSDAIAIGAMKAARERGVLIPRDLKIVGFDNITAGRVTDIPLTTIDPPCNEIGRTAFRMLNDIFSKRPLENPDVKLPCTLVERDTAPALQ